MAGYVVKIEGAQKLIEDAKQIKVGERVFTERFASDVAKAITIASPKSGIPWIGAATSNNTAVLSSSHPGAKALDKGAFIAPKGHPRLGFSVGGRQVFPKFVRLKGRHYVAKGMRARNKIATALWQEYMGSI